MLRSIFAFVAAVLVAASAMAQDGQGAKIVAAWETWASDTGVSETSIAIGYRGKQVATGGIGRAADQAYSVASLSKAITAVCADHYLVAGGQSFETPLSEIEYLLTDIGVTVPEHAKPLTIGTFVAQTSGMDTDITQGREIAAADGLSFDATTANQALAASAMAGELGAHVYNNGNYALLGAVIEALSGDSADNACRGAVLAPLGIETAKMDGFWAPRASYGGWAISAEDHLRFVMAHFGKDSPIRKSPFGYPFKELDRKAHYGMGMYFRRTGAGINFFHTGRLCWGRGAEDIGAYVMALGNGWTVSVNFKGCLKGDQVPQLETALWEAIHG